MIIFDLDGTLANYEHRRHFVDPIKDADIIQMADGDWVYKANYPQAKYFWKPNWPAFYEACDKDEPLEPTVNLCNILINRDVDIQIWSGRCESVRDKTILWLKQQLDVDAWFYRDCLKMRPIGDHSPDDVLKERWLDEAIAEGKTIDFVFDSGSPCEMWNRRGIMVFKIMPG